MDGRNETLPKVYQRRVTLPNLGISRSRMWLCLVPPPNITRNPILLCNLLLHPCSWADDTRLGGCSTVYCTHHASLSYRYILLCQRLQSAHHLQPLHTCRQARSIAAYTKPSSVQHIQWRRQRSVTHRETPTSLPPTLGEHQAPYTAPPAWKHHTREVRIWSTKRKGPWVYSKGTAVVYI